MVTVSVPAVLKEWQGPALPIVRSVHGQAPHDGSDKDRRSTAPSVVHEPYLVALRVERSCTERTGREDGCAYSNLPDTTSNGSLRRCGRV